MKPVSPELALGIALALGSIESEIQCARAIILHLKDPQGTPECANRLLARACQRLDSVRRVLEESGPRAD
jgi:hypothetical protein